MGNELTGRCAPSARRLFIDAALHFLRAPPVVLRSFFLRRLVGWLVGEPRAEEFKYRRTSRGNASQVDPFHGELSPLSVVSKSDNHTGSSPLGHPRLSPSPRSPTSFASRAAPRRRNSRCFRSDFRPRGSTQLHHVEVSRYGPSFSHFQFWVTSILLQFLAVLLRLTLQLTTVPSNCTICSSDNQLYNLQL